MKNRKHLILFIKIFVFILPIAYYIFFLPVSFFGFRAWEPTMPTSDFKVKGPFYPYLDETSVEVGDLGSMTKYAIKRKIRWVTDQYGFRNKPSNNDNYDVIFVGGSYLISPGVDQDKLITEVFMHETGLRAYGYSNQTLDDFLHDERFTHNKPKVVVKSVAERSLFELLQPPKFTEVKSDSVLENNVLSDEQEASAGMFSITWFMNRLKITKDRIRKDEIRRYIAFLLKTHTPFGIVGKENFLFLGVRQISKSMNDIEKRAKNAASNIKFMSDEFKKHDIHFIFMPIPGKYTVYSQLLHEAEEATYRKNFKDRQKSYLHYIEEALAGTDVNYINLAGPFISHANSLLAEEKYIYMKDDTHWNDKGIDIAAKIVSKKVMEILSGEKVR